MTQLPSTGDSLGTALTKNYAFSFATALTPTCPPPTWTTLASLRVDHSCLDNSCGVNHTAHSPEVRA